MHEQKREQMQNVLFATIPSCDDPLAVSVPREIVSGWRTQISTDARRNSNSHAPRQHLVLAHDRLVFLDRVPYLHWRSKQGTVSDESPINTDPTKVL